MKINLIIYKDMKILSKRLKRVKKKKYINKYLTKKAELV